MLARVHKYNYLQVVPTSQKKVNIAYGAKKNQGFEGIVDVCLFS
jgi:hypothetical protein